MKKQLFVVLGILFALNVSVAQTTPASFQWERSQNGVASTNNYLTKVLNDANGNTYSLSYSNEDMLVVKFNSTAQPIQVYRFNNAFNANDYPKDFEIDATGNVYIAGQSYFNGKYYMTVVKFDPSGNVLWNLHYNPGNLWVYPTLTTANAIDLDNSGNVYFSGSLNDSMLVVKTDPNGSVLWGTKINSTGLYSGVLNDLAVDAFGSVYACGKYLNSGVDYNVITTKLNSSGAVLWTKTIAGNTLTEDNGKFLSIDNSANVYVAAEVADSSSGNYSAYLTKYNSSGAQQWQKKFYNSGQVLTEVEKLIVDNLGNSYLAFHTSIGASTGYSIVKKHNSNGSQQYSFVIDDPLESDNTVTDMYLDQNNAIYAAGQLNPVGKAFYQKINSNGSSGFYGQFDHSAQNDLFDRVGITVEQSGFFSLITTRYKVLNERFNNSGVYQYEGNYAGESNTYDDAVRVLAQGSNSVYAYGFVQNEYTGIDAVLSKYNSEGDLMWQNIIDHNGSSDTPYGMTRDSVFNIYITKQATWDSSEVIKYDSIGSPLWSYVSKVQYEKTAVANGSKVHLAGSSVRGSAEYENFSVAVLDGNGNLLSSSTPNTNSNVNLYTQGMAIDSLSQIVVAGKMVYHYGLPDMKTTLVVEKYSNTGTLLWHRSLPIPDSTSTDVFNYSKVQRVVESNSNEIFIHGTVYIASGFGHSQAFLAKYNSAGVLQYFQLYDGNGSWHEYGADIKLLSNGKIIMLSADPTYYIVKKIEPNNGSVIWENVINYAVSAIPVAMSIDANDDIFFTGSSTINYTQRDIVLGKINSSGVLKWITSKSGSAFGADMPAAIDVTNSGRIYIAAGMNNQSGSSKDFSLLKFCDINQPSLVTTGQTQNICVGSTITFSTSGGVGYLWNDGTTTNDTLIASATGDYFCSVIKNDGCAKNTDTVHVQLKLPPTTPQICLVTVDSMSTHNIVVWDKSNVVGATAFNIYREDVTNVYSYIGTVLYDSLSEFHDYGANPNVTTKRYKITAIDTCGQESNMSNYHNTIYIVSNGSGQFSWNPIYTIENTLNPVDNYLLMRDDLSNGNWTQIQSTAGNQNTIVDPQYASYPNASWRVETAWNISCLPTRGAINTSRSNIKSPTSIGINETTSTHDFMISPNPAGSNILVKANLREENLMVKIYDALGQELISEKMTGSELNLNIEQLSTGTYFIKLIGSKSQSVKKLIKL